ncbi:MAG: hypothetical protein ACRYG7_08935 [Janthinobacterium lividum]
MTTRLLFAGLGLGLCIWGQPTISWAQTPARRGQTFWYAIQNNVVVQKTGATAKPLKEEVKLPNGSRLKPLDRLVVLASGEEVKLAQDDMVTASGEVIRGRAPEAVASPAAASTPAATPTPAPAIGKAPTPTPAPAISKAATPAPAIGKAPTPTPAPAISKAATPASATGKAAKFAYVPTAPVNGKLKGVVELGASGFNSFIVRIDAQRNWKLEKAEFGNSLVLENMATNDDIRRGLKAYIGKMLDYGVGGRDIYFVVSSGASTAEVTKHIVPSLTALGYVVHAVTPEQEGAFGLRAAVPPAYADKAFLVDMGSANTKIAWQERGKTTVINSFGSKYYQQQVEEAKVSADVAAKAGQVPASRRQTCFIIGGIPYELAKAGRQGKEPYTVLQPADGYPQLEGAKIKAGLSIYKALAAATGCQQFVFGWDTNFTIGYLLEQPQ